MIENMKAKGIYDKLFPEFNEKNLEQAKHQTYKTYPLTSFSYDELLVLLYIADTMYQNYVKLTEDIFNTLKRKK